MMRTVSYSLPGHSAYEHRLVVPLIHEGLNYRAAAGAPREIEIFARELVRDGNENAPRIVFFQGGPGSAATRPEIMGGWVNRVLEDYRLVLLDERGTGQSSAIDARALAGIGAPESQASYLACFRQDSIVADAEALRRALQGNKPWSALGQSFGGFCITTYLSQAPEGLTEAMITAGLPSTHRHADDTYRLTYAQTERRHQEFFDRYPDDEETCWRIVEHLSASAAAGEPEVLPTGEALTARRLRMLGINLGQSYGFEKLHYMLEDPFVNGRLSSRFLNAVGADLSYGPNPLYWALHESIYQQRDLAPLWSAHRIRGEFPQFRQPEPTAAAERALRAEGYGFRFTGEHVFPWQGEEDPALAPMADAVNILAAREDLPDLHDRHTLATNAVPTVAWIYTQDMFVPAEICFETAADIAGLKTLVSEEYHHDALRTHGAAVIDAMILALNENS